MDDAPRPLDDELGRCEQDLREVQGRADAALARALQGLAVMLRTAFDARAREVVSAQPEVTHRLSATGSLPMLKARLRALNADADSMTHQSLDNSRLWTHRQPRASSAPEVGDLRPVGRSSGPKELPFDVRGDVDVLGKPFDDLFKEFGYSNVSLNFGSLPLSDDVVSALDDYADAAGPCSALLDRRARLLEQRDQVNALRVWEAA
ncbi:MAG: hypothetical protein JOY68_03285 [Candidatus Dormibacteraeota bacterium]|nr:hypothetical protein [Candidatus Dormibacteraeota bacterium]MBV8446270.1 hypothetical protein [Candidatus Dormibacteraeota bacterium]